MIAIKVVVDLLLRTTVFIGGYTSLKLTEHTLEFG